MDFSLTEAQQDLSGLTRNILDDQVTNTRLRAIESQLDRFDHPLWTELATAGVLSAALPESAGGSGFGLVEHCGVLVEMGRAVAPVPYLMSIAVAGSALGHFGDRAQQERWADPAGSGQLVLTAALSEQNNPDATTPAITTARRRDGQWVLSGSKTAVPAGPIADLFLVPAMTPNGPLVFLVAPTDTGVSVERQQVVDFDSEGCLDLADVRLDDDRVLGRDAGNQVLDWLITHSTVGLCALQLGICERALELTSEYARDRVQFDRPIGSFQAVAQRLADAYIDVQAIRLTMWQAAWCASEGRSSATEAATAKFWAADAGHRVAHTAVHVHGGVGIDLDHHLHRHFVAAKRTEFALGAATAQLRTIGAALASVTGESTADSPQ